MRRANGTGSIVKLSGNRRRPYVARIAQKDEFGRIKQVPLSYHAKLSEAQEALDDYTRNKAAGIMPRVDKMSTTLGEAFQLWSAKKFEKVGSQSIDTYNASWTRLSRYKNMRIRDLTIDDLQSIIDEDIKNEKSESTMRNDKMLMKALFRYAMQRDIVFKDYSEFVEIPVVDPKHAKGSLSELQIERLKKLAEAGFPWADTVLMLCYTGYRITEFLTLTPFAYDEKECALTGGLKTEAGKTRVIPVHPVIQPYLDQWLAKKGTTIICDENGKRITSAHYRNYCFPPVMEQLGLTEATPHWCRHTMATRLHDAKAPDLETKRILGHADDNVTEHYTHTDIQELRAAILLLA